MQLAIIDLDGVIANADVRFAKAEEAKQAFMADQEARFEAIFSGSFSEKEATNIYWRTVFDPELVELDTLIEGAREAISTIEQDEEENDIWLVVYMTSRPESMRAATWLWLDAHGLSGPRIIHKPSAFQYTKTTVWKAGMVQTLSAYYMASRVLVVDDEQANLNEITRAALVPPQVRGLITAKNLSEAVAKVNGTWVEPDPFLPEE